MNHAYLAVHLPDPRETSSTREVFAFASGALPWSLALMLQVPNRPPAATQDESSWRYRGWRVVIACFTIAMFAWGFGFYGHGVFLAELSPPEHSDRSRSDLRDRLDADTLARLERLRRGERD